MVPSLRFGDGTFLYVRNEPKPDRAGETAGRIGYKALNIDPCDERVDGQRLRIRSGFQGIPK